MIAICRWICYGVSCQVNSNHVMPFRAASCKKRGSRWLLAILVVTGGPPEYASEEACTRMFTRVFPVQPKVPYVFSLGTPRASRCNSPKIFCPLLCPYPYPYLIHSSDTNSGPITCERPYFSISRKYIHNLGLAGKSLARLSLAAGYLSPFTCSKIIH